MFSPDVGTHSHSPSRRPKRPRQPAGSNDSIKLPQAKRKRAALRKDTFEPLAQTTLSEIVRRHVEANGHAVGDGLPPSISGVQSRELTLRGGKKSEKRQDRSSGALVLSSNEFYNVAQLPALPDQIRNHPGIPYSCAISAEYGWAIALTHTDALVWAYNSASTSLGPRDLLSFKLPFPPASAIDPLPLAAFTARSAAGEPGIIVVSPNWGKVVYWETITNASSFIPGQTSSGIQGSISGLSAGEILKEIINAEPSGFIATSSHNRVVHITIRDQMGRPGIGVKFLRAPTSGTIGGLFGSIRHVFGVDRRKGVPSVRAGKSSKGQRDVIICSEDGEIEFWSTHLGIDDSLIKSVSLKEVLLQAVQTDLPSNPSLTWTLSVLDFELAVGRHRHHEVVQHAHEESTHMTVLAALSNRDRTRYYLIEVLITGQDCSVEVVHPIKCYFASLSASAMWRAKLCIPRFSNIAFVVLERAVLLFSLARLEESPSSQLLMERQAPPDPFQDCVKFQEDTVYRVLATTGEDRDKADNQASCVVAVQGFGLVRLSTQPIRRQTDEDEDIDFRISPKSKIEQAIFFGTIRSNPLDLTSSTTGQSFTADEISSAALEISYEILSSSSGHLPKSTPSIEMQMKLRAKSLEDLILYLMKHYSTSLPRASRFELLWNAEKLAAAQAIWKVEEDIERRYSNLKDRELPYMHFVLRALHESRQTYPDAARGEIDRVRHWLIHDPEKLGHFVTELVSCIDELAPMDINNPQVVAEYLREAQDLWIAAYETAFKFREDNAQNYGLGDEVFKDGVLQVDYPDTVKVWSTEPEPLEFGERFIFEICNFLQSWTDSSGARPKTSRREMPVDENGKPYDVPSKEVIGKLKQQLAVQAALFSRMLDEASISEHEQVKRQGGEGSAQTDELANLTREYRSRLRRILEAVSFFNALGAIALAEKIGDTGLLVDLNTAYLRKLLREKYSEKSMDVAEVNRIDEQLQALQKHAEAYYDTFGNQWAFAHFSRNIRDGQLSEMLQEAQANDGKKQGYLTWFLKKCHEFGYPVGKISWINEILGERRYDRAVGILESVSVNNEKDLWGKKTEICLAKLADLAAAEDAEAKHQSFPTRSKEKLLNFDHALAVMDIQQMLLEHVLSFTTGALDLQAAQELSFGAVSGESVENKPALKSLLKHGIESLVAREALTLHQLVDILTLMQPVQYQGPDEVDPGILGHEFSLALQVLDDSDGLDLAEKQSLQRLIWRRAMIRDDWIKLNETSLKDDETVQREMQMSSLFVTLAQILDDQRQHPDKTLKLYSPQEILDAELFPASLRLRFEKRDQDQIEKELQAEQDRLKLFIEKGRLDLHFGGLLRSAEEMVRSFADAEGQRVAHAALSDDDVNPVNGEEMVVTPNGFH